MEIGQVKEWTEAQNIALSIDLVEAAKQHLKFLAVVDQQNRYLYEDPALQWAIYRYNAFWLPLLAKHMESPVSEDPLVVPLDCEWVWHCHRLNPIRYKLDCEKLFGRILGNQNVISSVQATSKSTTEKIWNKMYPEEPYELDSNRPFPGDALTGSSHNKFTSYDLVSAVKRQVPFAYKVSRPHMSHDLFLQEAVARYKGFMHLVRTNKEKNINRICVPTYDIDLIWHTHQLHPDSYCKDMNELVGEVLHHDDNDTNNDSDSLKSEGSKVDIGFSETTKQWEETFGLRYWKAGAMYRGSPPTPVTQTPFKFSVSSKEFTESCKIIEYPAVKSMEVVLEFVDIKNLPEDYKRNLLVSFSKRQPDKLFCCKNTLSILSKSTEKQVARFECEPAGEFLFDLLSDSPSDKQSSKSPELLGSCSFSMQELLASESQLSVDNWLSVKPVSCLGNSKPILLRVSVSFTPPTPAPQSFELEWPKPSSKDSDIQASVTDDNGNKIFGLQMRDTIMEKTEGSPDFLKEVYCTTNSGQKHKLAECRGDCWCIKGAHGSFKLLKNTGNDGHLFELVGYKMVKVFPGRRLEFEPKHNEKQRSEQEFATAVEFSKEHPYGRAVGLIDLKSGTLKTTEEWIALPGITLAFICQSDCDYGCSLDGDESKQGSLMAANGNGGAKHPATIMTNSANCSGARCWCLAATIMTNSVDCSGARCWCIGATVMTNSVDCSGARCWCIGYSRNHTHGSEYWQ